MFEKVWEALGWKGKLPQNPGHKVVKESWGYPYYPSELQGDAFMVGTNQYNAIGYASWGINNPIDRAYGADYPFVRNEQDLGRIRNSSRFCYRTNPNANGVVETMISYVIGNGFMAHFSSETDPEGAAQCQEFVNNWYEISDFVSVQEEIFRRSRYDGEVFVRMFNQEDGNLKLRMVEPELVTQPAGTSFPEWGFGIQTDPSDSQTVYAYNVKYNNETGTAVTDNIINAKDIVHLKTNVTAAMKRGISDFTFSTLEMFNLALKLTRNVGEGSAIQAAIAAIREHEGVTADQIDDFLDTQKSGYPYSQGIPGNMLPSAFSGYSTVTPGAVLDMTNNTKYVEPPGGKNVSAHLEVLQAVLRAAGMKFSAPEWLVSGRADSMSFASSLTAESPFLRSAVRMQRTYQKCFKQIVIRALDNAALAELVPLDWKKTIKLEISAPSMEIRDKGAEARANREYMDMGIKSKKTITSEIGLDYAKELENRRREAIEDPHPSSAMEGQVIPGKPGQPAEIKSPASELAPADPETNTPQIGGSGEDDGKKKRSKLEGVTFDKSKQKWKAEIHEGSVTRHIGYFRTSTQAHNAYLNVAPKK
jgi:hypothetical protein